MVRTAGGGARPVWANDYTDDDHGRSDSEEEQVSEEEYNPSKSKKVFLPYRTKNGMLRHSLATLEGSNIFC